MTSPVQHTDVGAYAIGALDAADAARFEEHLAWCEWCAAELEELMGLGPLLSEYRESAPDTASLTARPSPELLNGLLAETAAAHRTSRRRRLYLVAAAAALIITAPVATMALVSDDSPANPPKPPDMVQALYEDGEKVSGADPVTDVNATVAMRPKGWGTEIAVKLANVSGPRECGLIAIGKDGTEQTVTTWSVPGGGYGWKDARYYVGGAAFDRDEIDRFEVRTLDGDHLVTVKA
ncbi:anti-sigma factor family protein [Streptomyces gobiensis]|uniref:anti-sigma factor family protein n=1 Tax=Streptomyces gobiensis TaxID=2875706 RepID=UPI001E627AB5|nr:zf-HC2 domain-containing protein [Streptomyces gobiensis]UGY91707.1 zf-HC2 domain-containing protein [Streptomyces gobiensis]